MSIMKEPDKRRQSKSSAPSGPADSDESPRAAKRDGKPATERHIPSTHEQEVSVVPADNRGRRRRLQDPLPLEEAPRRGDGRASFHQQPPQQQQHSVVLSGKEFFDANAPAAPVDPTYVPRSGYYFQHDDRTGPLPGRNNKRRDFDRDSRLEPRAKSRYDERPRDVKPDHHGRRNERHQESLQAVPHMKADDAWAHDKYLESQGEDSELKQQVAAPQERSKHTRRRGFQETPPERREDVQDEKIVDPDKRLEKRHPESNDKRPEKRYPDMNLAQRERERYRERGADWERGRWMDADSQRGRFNPRQSYSSRYTGDVDRAGGRFEMSWRNSGGKVADKWSHDRFEELNGCPATSKQEEDSIAQIEALLAA